MNHGGLGRVTTDSLFISPDLLRPIFVDEGATVFGLYYPAPDRKYTCLAQDGESVISESGLEPNSDPSNPRILEDFPLDLILTPIPPEAWPYVAKVKIHIQHMPGAIHAITDFLRQKGINILFSELTRQNRIFAVLTMVVSLKNYLCAPDGWNLKTEPSNFNSHDEAQRLLRAHYNAFQEIVINLFGSWKDPHTSTEGSQSHDGTRGVLWNDPSCESFIFSDVAGDTQTPNARQLPGWRYPERAISVSKMASLKYFHWRMVERSFTRGREAPLHRAFQLDCPKAGQLNLHEKGKLIMRQPDLVNLLPALAAAEMDTREMLCRLSILPNEKLAEFREISVNYSCPQGSTGLLSLISGSIKDRVDIWRTVNSVRRFQAPEHGYVKLLVNTAQSNRSASPSCEQLEDLIRSGVKAQPTWLPNAHIEVQVNRLNHLKIFVSIRHGVNFKRRAEFLELTENACKSLGIGADPNLKSLILVDDPEGTAVTKVTKGLREANGFLQFFHGCDFTKPDSSSVWLESEALAAATLDLPMRIIGPPRTKAFAPRPVINHLVCQELAEDESHNQAKSVIFECVKSLVSEIEQRFKKSR